MNNVQCTNKVLLFALNDGFFISRVMVIGNIYYLKMGWIS